jgi:hypothetical protein
MAKASPSCAMEGTVVLAAGTIRGRLAMVVEVGANAMPRRTSPATAVRKIVKVSADAPAAVVLANLLGSAPGSPLVLTVEVTA